MLPERLSRFGGVVAAGPSHPWFKLGPMTNPFTDSLTISCDDCLMQGTDACEDCVVTFICGRDPNDAVIVDAEEARAVRMLGSAGLVPRLRHVRRSGCA